MSTGSARRHRDRGGFAVRGRVSAAAVFLLAASLLGASTAGFPASGKPNREDTPFPGRVVYFIASRPVQDAPLRFPTLLFRLDPSTRSLRLLRTVIDAKTGTLSVRPYHEERVVVAREMEGAKGQVYALVDMNEPWREEDFRFVVTRTPAVLVDYLLSLSKTDHWLAIFQYFGGPRPLEGVHLSSFQQSALEWRDYRHARMYGEPGGAIPGGDTLLLHATASGSMEVRRGGIWTDLEWPLPDTRSFEAGEIVLVRANQSHLTALTSAADREVISPGLGSVVYHVREKPAGRWHRAVFPGANAEVRAFEGPWLGGHALELRPETPSPGREERRREMTETGDPFDWRTQVLSYYFPGILFVYDAKNRRKYQWETGQGDSEVLLVDGETVYYRVNRSIHSARIGEERLEDHTLLVEDDVVPDIHWAFLGPPPPPDHTP
jgi:hypothetical protein